MSEYNSLSTSYGWSSVFGCMLNVMCGTLECASLSIPLCLSLCLSLSLYLSFASHTTFKFNFIQFVVEHFVVGCWFSPILFCPATQSIRLNWIYLTVILHWQLREMLHFSHAFCLFIYVCVCLLSVRWSDASTHLRRAWRRNTQTFIGNKFRTKELCACFGLPFRPYGVFYARSTTILP